LTVAVWRAKIGIHVLRNIHNPPAEGNFYEEKRDAIESMNVDDYIHYMVYMDKGDRMGNSYLITCNTWKRRKKFSSIC
jgi:hypothetical protein